MMNFENLMSTFSTNRVVYDDLLEDIRKNGIVPVFGAGMSVWAGYPLWKDLLSNIASQSNHSGHKEEAELLIDKGMYEQAASRLEEYFSKIEFSSMVKKAYDPNKLEESKRPSYQYKLRDIFRGPIVTTNFDVSLDRLFNTSVICSEDSFQENQFHQSVQNKQQAVIKLHGSIDNSSKIILTEERYNEVYGNDPDFPDENLPLPKALITLFSAAKPLFLGCGLGSDRTTNVLAKSFKGNGYALLSLPKETQNIENPFEPAIIFESGKDFCPSFIERRKIIEEMGLRVIWYPYGYHEAVHVLIEQIHADLENEADRSKKHSLDASILRIDREYLDGCIIDDEREKEELQKDFYTTGHSKKIVFQMLVNDLAVRNEEYDNICKKVLAAACEAPITFLAGNGGMGKSILLGSVALSAIKEGFDVYYLDGHPSKFPKLNHKTLFVIDDALKHQDLISKLYAKYCNRDHIHILVADRIHRINAVIDEVSNDIIRWKRQSKAVVLVRNTKDNQLEEKIILSTADAVEKIFVSNGLIKTISDKIIESTIIVQKLNSEINVDINYNNKTIADAIVDYFVGYNKVGDKHAEIKKYEFDWDVWNNNPKLEGLFRYVAALHSCGVEVSINCLETMKLGSGDALLDAINNGMLPVVRVQNGFIQLRHDTVADNYFQIRGDSPYDALVFFMENDWMDEDTVVRFEKQVFSLKNIQNPSVELMRHRIPELLSKFNNNARYRSILKRRRRIHSLELALIMHKVTQKQYRDQEELTKDMGASFVAINKYYGNPEGVWIRYFVFASRVEATLPIEMLEIMEIKVKYGLYKRISSYIKRSYLEPKNLWISNKEERYLLQNAEEVFNWIITKINKGDTHSRYALARIYEKREQYPEAVSVIEEMESMPDPSVDKYNCATRIISLLKKERKYLIMHSDRKRNPRIYQLEEQIIDRYEKWIGLIKKENPYSGRYIQLITGYVDFLQIIKKMGLAFELLMNTLNDYESSGVCISLDRIYQALGRWYQDPRNKRKDLEQAIIWYQKALDSTNGEKKNVMSAVKPLCKSHLALGNYEECKALCRQMYGIDSKDPEVFLLMIESHRLEHIKEKELFVGKGYDEEWLESAEEEEIIAASEVILEMMTKEQRAYADELGCSDKYDKPTLVKASYQILHCINNNYAIPINLQSRWTIDWEKKSILYEKYFRVRNEKNID